MNKHTNEFAEQLVDAQPIDSVHQQKYKKEITAMYEKKLTGLNKVTWIFSTMMGLFFVGVFSWAFAISADELPLLARLGFAAGALFGLGIAAYSVKILLRGKYNLKTDAKGMLGMMWVFIVIMVTLFMMLAPELPDPNSGIFMLLNALIFLVMAATFMTTGRTDQAELKTREKLLEMECRLAEISEKLDQQPKN